MNRCFYGDCRTVMRELIERRTAQAGLVLAD